MQSIYDDECVWSDFKIKAGIVGTPWKLYSPEYNSAKQGFHTNGFTGKRLKLYVQQAMEVIVLKEKHNKELQELQLLETLEKKYK